jgi:hypothetical protein
MVSVIINHFNKIFNKVVKRGNQAYKANVKLLLAYSRIIGVLQKWTVSNVTQNWFILSKAFQFTWDKIENVKLDA